MSETLRISEYFMWREALWLPKWGRLATDAEANMVIKVNLTDVFFKLDYIRDHFDKQIIVHCAFRPPEYNKLVGGAEHSCHLYGMAVDFHIEEVSCDDARREILDKNLLNAHELRMEDSPGSNWIHLDTKEVENDSHRCFKP